MAGPDRESPLSPATEKSGRRLLDRWRLRSPSGAAVVSLRQLNTRERLRVTSPSMLTTGNMACGFSAVLLAFGDHFTWAAAMLAGSIVLDIADGAVARLVGATSPFGVQLDSLSDLVSFGLAPAVLVHTWALPENPVLAWLSAFLWLACAAFRLARFNVTVDPLADKKYFVGLPSPGATLVVIATIVALGTPEHGPGMLVPVAVSVVPALLMVTTVRFRSFRGLLSPRTSQSEGDDDLPRSRARRRTRARRSCDRSRGRLRLPAHGSTRRAHRPAARAGLRTPGGGSPAAPDAVGVPADRRGRTRRRVLSAAGWLLPSPGVWMEP